MVRSSNVDEGIVNSGGKGGLPDWYEASLGMRDPFSAGVFTCALEHDTLKSFPRPSPCAHSRDVHIRNLEFTAYDRGLWRANLAGLGLNSKLRPFAKSFGPKWGRVLQSYVARIPNEFRPYIAETLVGCDSLCEDCFIDFQKTVSTRAAQLNIERSRGWWTYLCDLVTLGGYDTVKNRKDVLTGYDKVLGRGGGGILDDKLKYYIRDTIDKIGFKPTPKQVSLEHFIRFRDAWAIPGACTHGEAAHVKIGDKETRVKGKFASMLHLTDEQILALAKEKDGAKIYPFLKGDEPAKARVVQSYDFRSYLRVSWLDSFLSSYNKNGVWTTLGMTVLERASARRKLLIQLRYKDRHASSVDQSAFDENQSLASIMYALEYLFGKIKEQADPALRDEVAKIVDLELYSASHAKFYHKTSDGEKFMCHHKRGIASGYKYTALLDSILNRAESLWACDYIGVTPVDGLWQGDDAVVIVKSKRMTTPLDWAEAYTAMNLVVNELKSFISDRRFEFLHEITGPEGGWGFPARCFKSVLWKKPNSGTSGFSPPHVRKSELWDTLTKCQRRGMNVAPLLSASLRKELHNSGHNKDAVPRLAEAIMATPCIFGGLGWGLSGRLGFRWTSPKTYTKKVTITSKIGYKTGYDGRIAHDSALQRLGQVVALPVERAKLIPVKAKAKKKIPSVKIVYDCKIKTDWFVDDFKPGIDAWSKKLALEWCISRGKYVQKDLLPSSFLREHIDGGKLLRWLKKFEHWAPNLSSYITSAEPFALLSEWASNIWAGTVIWLATSGNKTEVDGRKSALASMVWDRARTMLLGMRVCV